MALVEVTPENLDDVFSYHSPSGTQPERFLAISRAMKEAARAILENVPRCPDRTRAINALRDARMLANAAVALEHVEAHTNIPG